MNSIFRFAKRIVAYGKERLTAPKPKHAKTGNTLLRTYFTSLLSLMLCVTMFLSTTYAWFSSEVTNTGNEIYIGTLDVGLYKQNGEDLLDMSDSAHQLFNDQIIWEPGHTVVETIHITNKGELAFKYLFGFTDGSLSADSTMLINEAAQCFEVWVFPHVDDAVPAATDYASISAEGSGWTNAGTLDTLLNGGVTLQGVLFPGNAVQQPAGFSVYTVALHMLDDATPAVMGQKLSLNVKLIAHQLTAEDINYLAPATPDDTEPQP